MNGTSIISRNFRTFSNVFELKSNPAETVMFPIKYKRIFGCEFHMFSWPKMHSKFTIIAVPRVTIPITFALCPHVKQRFNNIKEQSNKRLPPMVLFLSLQIFHLRYTLFHQKGGNWYQVHDLMAMLK